MSKVIGFIVGAALIVVGIATGNVGLIIQGGVMIVSNAVMLLSMAKAPARLASEMTIQLGEQPRSAIFGEAATAGSLVDGFNYGGKYGTDYEVLMIRLADHKCDGLVGFYVNDEYQVFTANGTQPGRDGSLRLWFRGDTTAEALPSIVTSEGPGWTSGDRGYSGCDVVVAYKADSPDEKHPEWPGGRPRFLFVVKGKHCYDPRKDSTVPGGSGSHRWNTPSTWEWSDNPAVCRYNWVRGIYANDDVTNPAQLLIGRGLSESEAPPENIFAAANLCDELVEGQKRYRVDGPIYAHQPHIEVEEMFAAATGGSIVTREGSVELEPGAAKSVVAHFTDDDLLTGSDVKWNQGMLSDASGEWVNSVVARYVEPSQKWNDHAAPVRRDTADIIADGRPREASITLRLVSRSAQAQRVAEIARRLGRLWGRAQVTLGPRFCELEDGDWVNWTSMRRFGGETKTFRVEAYSINEKWHNTLTLRQINSTVFGAGTFIADQAEANPNDVPPAIGAPEVGAWTLTTEQLTGSGAAIPALVISGAVDDLTAEAIRFEYWKDDGVIDPVVDPDSPPWVSAGVHGPGVTRREITSIVSGADYYAAVSYVVDGIPGDRRVLGPVTAGVIDVSGQTAYMGDMPEVFVDADYTGAILTGELPLPIQGRRYLGETEVTEAATWSVTVVSGAITITDLTPTAGTIEVTDLDATAQLRVESTYNGLTLFKTQIVTLRLAPPPAGSAGSSDSTFNSINSTSMAAISDELTITVGASGTVDLSAPLTVKTAKSGADGVFEVFGRWQWLDPSGPTWTDLGAGETASHPDCTLELLSEPTVYALSPGTLNVAAQKTGLTAGSSHKFRLRARNASGTRTMTFTGTATATTS